MLSFHNYLRVIIQSVKKDRLFSSIILLLFTANLITGCLPSPAQPPTVEGFAYSVHVEAKTTRDDIPRAYVIIQVAGKAPLDGLTDDNGFVRIPFDSSYVDRSARLIVEAGGYIKYCQEIDLRKGMLPDWVQLEPIISSGKPTATPTDYLGYATPFPTDIPTPPLPWATPTKWNASSPPPTTTGRLAIPLMLGTSLKVYIVSTEGVILGDLDMARQPDYTQDGDSLVVNGDGGPLDKLRVAGPTGKPWREIGDRSLGGHSHPAWSPDGTQVIYDDNTIGGAHWRIFRRNLNDTNGEGQILEAATGPILGTNPLYPIWASGDRFVFEGCNSWSGGGDCGLWVMQGDHGAPQKLKNAAIPTDVNGDWLVYTSNEAGNWNVYVLNLTTQETRQLTSDPANDGLATISPDGQWVAYLSNSGGSLAVWYVSIKGGNPEKMFNIPQEWGTLRADGWTEEKLSWGDDKEIIPKPTPDATITPVQTSTPTPMPSQTVQPPDRMSGKLVIPLKLGTQFKVYITSFEGQGITQLESVNLTQARQPLFRYDGQAILMNGTQTNSSGVFITNGAGQGPELAIDKREAIWPVWSPDGKEIIFADSSLENQLFKRESDKQISAIRAKNNNVLHGKNVIWSDDNRLIFWGCGDWEEKPGECGIWVTRVNVVEPKRILITLGLPMDAKNGLLTYMSAEDGDWDIYVIPIDGGQPRNITNNSFQDGLPTIAPDDRKVAYMSNESGDWALWTIDLDTNQKQKWSDIDPKLGSIDTNNWTEERMSWSR